MNNSNNNSLHKPPLGIFSRRVALYIFLTVALLNTGGPTVVPGVIVRADQFFETRALTMAILAGLLWSVDWFLVLFFGKTTLLTSLSDVVGLVLLWYMSFFKQGVPQ